MEGAKDGQREGREGRKGGREEGRKGGRGGGKKEGREGGGEGEGGGRRKEGREGGRQGSWLQGLAEQRGQYLEQSDLGGVTGVDEEALQVWLKHHLGEEGRAGGKKRERGKKDGRRRQRERERESDQLHTCITAHILAS